jgi:uncharacterized membrane protein
MDIIIAIIVGVVTLIILGISNPDSKTSNQLMLIGIEITIVGVAFLIMSYSYNSATLYFLGVAIIVIGFTTNIFGFGKK